MLIAFLVSAVCLADKSTVERKVLAFDQQQTQKLTKHVMAKRGLARNFRVLSARPAKSIAKAKEVVTPPEDGELEYFTLTGTINVQGQKQSLKRKVSVVWVGDDDVYISGLSYFLPEAFVKGTFVDDETVVFEKGQYFGAFTTTSGTFDLFFGATTDGDDFVDAIALFEGETFTFSANLVDNDEAEELGSYAEWESGLTISPLQDDDEEEVPVEIPSNLKTETYAYSARDYFSGHALVSGNINVGFYGEDVYLQGMSTDFPEAWIKGTFVNDTTVVFASGQMLDKSGVYFISSDLSTVVDKYILYYDVEEGVFYEGEYYPMISGLKNDFYLYQFYYGYVISKISEKAATPAPSLITGINHSPSSDVLEYVLAKVDVEGYGLVADKLAYKVYYATEKGDTTAVEFLKSDYASLDKDMTEIPATFVDGKDFKDGALTLKMKHDASWIGIGIQAVYYGGEERNESEIAWYNPTWPQTITLPEGLAVTKHIFKGETYERNGNAPFEREVSLAFDGDVMYIGGLGEINEDSWVKGIKTEDDTYVFPMGQSLGSATFSDGAYSLFLVGIVEDGYGDVVLNADPENDVYEFENSFLENASYTDHSYYVTRFVAGSSIAKAEIKEEEPEVVVVPEGLETSAYSFSATDFFDDSAVSRNVYVGFDGDDVYVQGLSETLPKAWVKGTVDGDQITFATGQFLGYDDDQTTLWFIGINPNNTGIIDYVMTYDEEANTLTNTSATNLLGVNAYKSKISRSVYELYENVTIKLLTEKAATPATPSISTIKYSPYGYTLNFTIPARDVDGDGLVTDKLSYKLYFDNGNGEPQEVTFTTDLYENLTEDMTIIPYGFIDVTEERPYGWDFDASLVYLNMDISDWARVGIQSIYTGGGESNVSEIGWYTITYPQVVELPEEAEVKTYGFIGTYYSSSGTVNFTKQVNVALVGEDVYVQGVGRASDEAWIKGTKSETDNTYTFSNGQYMGVYGSSADDLSFLFLMGYNSMRGVMDVKMTFNEETGIFTTTTEIVENADYTDRMYYLTRIQIGAQLIPGDNPDAISTVTAEEGSDLYNISGLRVQKNYKGIVVKGGKKYLQK